MLVAQGVRPKIEPNSVVSKGSENESHVELKKPAKVGQKATPTQIVLVLVSGCRVLHHAILFDSVISNGCVRIGYER
jgi:hypothetical protein